MCRAGTVGAQVGDGHRGAARRRAAVRQRRVVLELVPSNVTSNRFAPANQVPWTEDAESNDAPVKSASRRSCADRHEPGPNCTPWKLAARAVLPLPVAAPNDAVGPLGAAEVGGGRGDVIEHGDLEHRPGELRVGQIDALQRHLVEARVVEDRAGQQHGVAPLGWKVTHARFAMVKSAWLMSMAARLAPSGQAFQLRPARLQNGQFLEAFRVATSFGFACAGPPTPAATASGRMGRGRP